MKDNSADSAILVSNYGIFATTSKHKSYLTFFGSAIIKEELNEEG